MRYVYMSEMSRLTVELVEGKLVVRDTEGRTVELDIPAAMLRQTLDFLGYVPVEDKADNVCGEYIRAA